MRLQEIAALIEEYAPFEGGIEGDELGLLFGAPEGEARGVATCWAPTLGVLEEAAGLGANMVISHEPLTYAVCGRDPEAGLLWYEERHATAKVPNQKRLGFAAANGLAVYRYHSNWDWAPRYGQADRLAAAVGLGERCGGERIAPVHAIEPEPLGDFVARVRRALDLGPVRVIGDLSRPVSRVAVCQGGFGQMFTFPEAPARGGADVALFGEMLDYTLRYCVEIDLAAVELGHFKSEEPGMIGMADFLRERLPGDIPVHYVATGEAWTWVGP